MGRNRKDKRGREQQSGEQAHDKGRPFIKKSWTLALPPFVSSDVETLGRVARLRATRTKNEGQRIQAKKKRPG